MPLNPTLKTAVLELAHRDPSGATHRTLAWWKAEERSDQALAAWVRDYADCIRPDGSHSHVPESLGYSPAPFKAWIRCGKTTLAKWPRRSKVTVIGAL